MNKNILLLVGSITVSLGVGGALGYYYATNALQEEFDSRLENETEELRRYYKRRYKTDEYETVQKAAERLSTTIKGPRSGIDIPLENDPGDKVLETIVQNLKYDTPNSPEIEEEWVVDAETQQENHDIAGPHIISVEDFTPNELEHHQPTWQYYLMDDTLVDESGEIVYDRDDIIGKGTLNCFGQGSGDADLVYVRNMELERDYEITRVHMSFNQKIESETTTRKPRHGNRAKA